jgi:uncharacterized protein (TIGR02452 family)
MDAAAVLRSKGYNPVILNMANAKTPGGGWRNGAGAQEESLFRRTNYLHSLIDPQRLGSKKRYPLPEFGGVYSPGVLSFRANEASGYAFLPAPEPYSFIAAAAINRPRLVQVSRGRKRLEPKSASKTKRKLGAVLSIGLDHGHDAIILSAFGCGAFKNPPEQIAEIFKELLIADPGSAYSSSATAGRQGKGNNTGRGLLQHASHGSLLPLPPIIALLACASHRAVDVCAVDMCAVCSHACRLVHRV